jgi:hypothetical protein
MPLGRFRRIVVATALTFTLGLICSDVPALGVGVPGTLDVTTQPALGAGPTLPATQEIQSLLSVATGTTAPVVQTPIPASSPPPTVPGPSGPSGSGASSTPARAVTSTAGTGRVREARRGVVRGDSLPVQNSEVTRAVSSARNHRAVTTRKRRQRTSHVASSPEFGIFHPSQLARLGDVIPADASSSPRFLGNFSSSGTTGATWAPPLLAIMFLIGAGGFLRVSRSPSRRRS